MTRARSWQLAVLAACALLAFGCDDGEGEVDAGADAGETIDAGTDSGPPPETDAGTDAGPPITCTEGCEIVELALGANHTCARRENGQVICWGRNREGQLGDGQTRHMDCGTGSDGMVIDCSAAAVRVRRQGTGRPFVDDALAISARGGESTCALRPSGEVWCWGLEGIARADGGNQEQRFLAQRVEDFGDVHAISDGFRPVCMIQGADRIGVCYGDNGAGQLGSGDKTQTRIPELARAVVDPEDPTGALEGLDEIAAFFVGETTCARVGDAAYCWGSNRDRQFGRGELTHDTCEESAADTFDCSDVPVRVGSEEEPLEGVAALTVGRGHVCALMEDATVMCWGVNRAGQLGLGVTDERAAIPTAVPGLSDVAEVHAGAHFTCARLNGGEVRCWGFNLNGQLGDDTPNHGETCTFGGSSGDCVRAPVAVTGIDDAVALAVGNTHACVIRESGELACWGRGGSRQLGTVDRDDAFAPVRVDGIPE